MNQRQAKKILRKVGPVFDYSAPARVHTAWRKNKRAYVRSGWRMTPGQRFGRWDAHWPMERYGCPF